jgi:hypothetical protein
MQSTHPKKKTTTTRNLETNTKRNNERKHKKKKYEIWNIYIYIHKWRKLENKKVTKKMVGEKGEGGGRRKGRR